MSSEPLLDGTSKEERFDYGELQYKPLLDADDIDPDEFRFFCQVYDELKRQWQEGSVAGTAEAAAAVDDGGENADEDGAADGGFYYEEVGESARWAPLPRGRGGRGSSRGRSSSCSVQQRQMEEEAAVTTELQRASFAIGCLAGVIGACAAAAAEAYCRTYYCAFAIGDGEDGYYGQQGSGGGPAAEAEGVTTADVTSAVAVSIAPVLPMLLLRPIAERITHFVLWRGRRRRQNGRNVMISPLLQSSPFASAASSSPFLQDALLEVEVCFGMGMYLIVYLFILLRDLYLKVGGNHQHQPHQQQYHLWFSLTLLVVVMCFFVPVKYLSLSRRRQRNEATTFIEDTKLGATTIV